MWDLGRADSAEPDTSGGGTYGAVAGSLLASVVTVVGYTMVFLGEYFHEAQIGEAGRYCETDAAR